MNPIEILLWGAAESLAKDICVAAASADHGHDSARTARILAAAQSVIEEAWAIEVSGILVRVQTLQSYA